MSVCEVMVVRFYTPLDQDKTKAVSKAIESQFNADCVTVSSQDRDWMDDPIGRHKLKLFLYGRDDTERAPWWKRIFG
jgi:hypothetical protein